MTIVECFKPVFKERGFRKKGKTFVKEFGSATQFVTFQRMTSFDDHHMTLGVAYADFPSNFVIRDAIGCPVDVDVQVLASIHGFKFSKADFNSNVEVTLVEPIAEVVMPLIDDWFGFWSDPELVRGADTEVLKKRRHGVKVWPKVYSFLGIDKAPIVS